MMAAGLLMLLLAPLNPPAAAAPPEQVRMSGYGISVGPHLPSRPDLLNRMNMNWVKLYDTVQIDDYPNHAVLYRVDMRGYPQDIDGWERGLYDLAAQLQRQGVVAVEIGNEPNLGFEWGGNPPNPEQFADALCRGYRAFKAVAPEIVIVSGGLASGAGTPDGMNMEDFAFAQRMLNAGAGACFDAFGYHPYGFNVPPEADPYRNEFSFRRTERMYALLWNNGIRDKQIWITEMGWVRDPGEEGLNCAADPTFRDFNWMKFPASTVAAYHERAVRFMEANWSFAGPTFFWNLNWNLYDAGYEPPCSHLRWYGFLDRAGNPLPVVDSLARTIKGGNAPPRNQPPTGPSLLADDGVVQGPMLGVQTSQGLTHTIEAGCGSQMEVGTFEVVNIGTEGTTMEVEIIPANGPGRPTVWTSLTSARPGTEVTMYADATGLEPGLHMLAVNLRTFDSDIMSSVVVRAWLLVHYPTTEDCRSAFEGRR
jgi:hypothetical protein